MPGDVQEDPRRAQTKTAARIARVAWTMRSWPGCTGSVRRRRWRVRAVPSRATIRADMETYTLTSKARPRVGLGQATCLYSVMEELGGGPATLDQIVEKCEYRGYASLLRTEPSVRASVKYHLKNWLNDGIVKKNTSVPSLSGYRPSQSPIFVPALSLYKALRNPPRSHTPAFAWPRKSRVFPLAMPTRGSSPGPGM
jgi:hypothetical protein